MLIRVKQINSNELALFVQQFSTGASFSGALLSYVNSSGSLGPQVVYVTGDQVITNGQKTFNVTPIVPYTGVQSGTISKQYVDDSVNNLNSFLLNNISGGYVRLTGVNFISGTNVITGSIYVPTPTGASQASNKYYVDSVSGILYNLLQSANIGNTVTLTGNQVVSGIKTFVNNPLGPDPTIPSGLATKNYVDNATLGFQPTGFVNLTGDQAVSGVKTFIQSPIVPVATQIGQATNLAQLNALGTVMGPISGFAGVMSINGSTGSASGQVYLQGAGIISVSQCGAIFYISGDINPVTLFYGVTLPLPSGITGINYVLSSGFPQRPVLNGTLEVSGASGSFIDNYFYGVTTGSFGVAFASAIPLSGNYFYNISAAPINSGSGFFGIQGSPGGLGPSGLVGATGAWRFRGGYVATGNYIFNDAVFLTGNTFGFSGISGTGYTPGTGTPWYVIAQKGDIGTAYFINSGTITGNFVNASFFLDPVSTGFNLSEAHISHSFFYTGSMFSCRTSGFGPTNGGILSGKLYQVDNNNTEQTLYNFTFNSGIIWSGSPNFNILVTGGNRIGLTVTNTLSGIQKFCVGIFGIDF